MIFNVIFVWGSASIYDLVCVVRRTEKTTGPPASSSSLHLKQDMRCCVSAHPSQLVLCFQGQIPQPCRMEL